MLAFFACVCYNAHTKMCDKVAILQIFVTTEYLFCCICIGRQKPFLEVLVESQGFFSSSAFLCFF